MHSSMKHLSALAAVLLAVTGPVWVGLQKPRRPAVLVLAGPQPPPWQPPGAPVYGGIGDPTNMSIALGALQENGQGLSLIHI